MATESKFSATVTAKTGPGKQITAKRYTDLVSLTLDVRKEVLTLSPGDAGQGSAQEFDLRGVTTITDTITNGIHVIVIS